METLEEIFKDAKKRMQRKVLERDDESQRKVIEIIKQMQDRILSAFPGHRAPYKYQGVLEQALAELRDIANSTNTRTMQEMCDRATGIVTRTEKKIEEEREENLTPEERKQKDRKAFGEGREDMHEGKREVNRRSAEGRLQSAVQTAFDKIRRAPLSNIGLRGPEIFSVEVAVDQVFKAYPQLFNQLFDKNVESVNKLLGKEYDDLEQVVTGELKREAQKEEQAHLEARARVSKGVLRSDILDDEPLKPWDLRNYGTSKEVVQKKSEEATQESSDKPKDPPKNKQLSTDWII